MLSFSTPRHPKATVAGGVAAVLAALAIAAPAGAAEPSPATGYSWGADDVALNFTNSDRAFNFTMKAQDFH